MSSGRQCCQSHVDSARLSLIEARAHYDTNTNLSHSQSRNGRSIGHQESVFERGRRQPKFHLPTPLLMRESRANFIEAFSVDSHTFFCCTCARLCSKVRQVACSGHRKCFTQVQDSQTLVSFLCVAGRPRTLSQVMTLITIGQIQ